MRILFLALLIAAAVFGTVTAQVTADGSESVPTPAPTKLPKGPNPVASTPGKDSLPPVIFGGHTFMLPPNVVQMFKQPEKSGKPN